MTWLSLIPAVINPLLMCVAFVVRGGVCVFICAASSVYHVMMHVHKLCGHGCSVLDV